MALSDLAQPYTVATGLRPATTDFSLLIIGRGPFGPRGPITSKGGGRAPLPPPPLGMSLVKAVDEGAIRHMKTTFLAQGALASEIRPTIGRILPQKVPFSNSEQVNFHTFEGVFC